MARSSQSLSGFGRCFYWRVAEELGLPVFSLNPFQGLVGVSTPGVKEVTITSFESQSLSGFGRCFYEQG